jgi:hypothetical protein
MVKKSRLPTGLKLLQHLMLQPVGHYLLGMLAIWSTCMEHRSLPDAHNCPITLGLMNNPVIDPEGNIFERAAVENLIRGHNTSAITRTPVSVLKDLYPNNAIARLLEEEKGQS